MQCEVGSIADCGNGTELRGPTCITVYTIIMKELDYIMWAQQTDRSIRSEDKSCKEGAHAVNKRVCYFSTRTPESIFFHPIAVPA